VWCPAHQTAARARWRQEIDFVIKGRGLRQFVEYEREQLAARDIPIRDLRSWNGQPDHQVKIDTVHRAKGLDFAAVYLPSLRSSSEASTTQAIAEHETLKLRQQFVGRTRARDRLWVGNVVRPVGRGPRAKG
jgi:superfamily I DNA/RNA helicase